MTNMLKRIRPGSDPWRAIAEMKQQISATARRLLGI
jgi:hypothetical protein